MSGTVRAGHHYLSSGGRAYLPIGASLVPPVGPDWPWRTGADAFEASFGDMARHGLDAARIDLLWAAIEPREGEYDQAHLALLDTILEAARRQGVRLHPTLFIGGQVGDAYWDVPWRAGRNPHADPTMRKLQAGHAAMLGRRWRGDPTILAWDLTDEPPFWLWPETSDADARAWTHELTAALREADPDHLITIGTSEQETGWGPFRADVVASELDFATVHPYPIYHPELYPDGLLARRMTGAGAFEIALAAGAGRPAMLHEYGASSAQYEPERIAAYDRLLAWSALGRGAIGLFAWCWTDAAPDAYGRAPYARQPHETQFGLTDSQGTLRPRGRALGEIAAVVRQLDLDGRAADGPRFDAALVVPHEWVQPYDPRGFGLDEAPAGLYAPAERAWSPRRDALPLMRALVNADAMASRAGLAVGFPRERLDGAWPDGPIVLLPAPLSSSTDTLLHLRTPFWAGVPRALARGTVAWLSCSAETAVPGMRELFGAAVADRAPAGRPAAMRFRAAWGPFEPGDELVLPPDDGTLATRGVRLAAAAGSRVVAVDADGEPALIVAARGAGHAVVCGQPVETLLATRPDAHGPEDETWGLYGGLADLARLPQVARVSHPEAACGTLEGPDGGIAIVTNHAAEPLELDVRLPEGVRSPRRIEGNGARPMAMEAGRVHLRLGAHEGLAIDWRRPD